MCLPPLSLPLASPSSSFLSPSFPQLGHNGVTPESCWLVDELAVAVPTKGIKYIFPCKCWLAKDRGDGLTARLFNVLDSNTINIIRKVSHKYEGVKNIQLYKNRISLLFICIFFFTVYCRLFIQQQLSQVTLSMQELILIFT